jgi:lysozyme
MFNTQMSIQQKSNSKIFGIDVSAYQGNIDWQRVKLAGVEFVFIKATEGATYLDKAFARNISGARKVAIPCGAYHYYQPNVSVATQIENFVRTVGRLQKGDLPPVLDVENPALWRGTERDKRVELIVQWLQGVETELGVTPFLYLSASFPGDVLSNREQLSKYPLWVANYTNAFQPQVPSPWRTWTFWQHSDAGAVDGIIGPVDLDWFAGSQQDLLKLLVI